MAVEAGSRDTTLLPPGAAARYVELRRLGEGGMGVTYRAYDRRLGRTVALKLIRPELARKRELRRRFLREIKTMSRLDEPTIVALYDLVEEGDDVLFTMEYLEGATLERLAAERALTVRRTVEVCRDVAAALAAVHAAQVIHRDVKPANVLVTTQGGAKLFDFGLAKSLADAEETGITKTGQMVGTLGFLPPEALCGSEQDARGDVYALGATAYLALCGRPPFAGGGFAAYAAAVKGEAPAPLAQLNPDVDEPLAAAVVGAMAFEAAARPSAEMLRDRFDEWLLAQRGARARPEAPGAVAPPPAHLVPPGAAVTPPGALGGDADPDPGLDAGKVFLAVAREAFRDGTVDGPENLLLQRLYKILGLDAEEATRLACRARESCRGADRAAPGTALQPHVAFREACRLAWADEVLGNEERRLLATVARILTLEAPAAEALMCRAAEQALARSMEAARARRDWDDLAAAAARLAREAGPEPPTQVLLLVDSARADVARAQGRWREATELARRLHQTYLHLYEQHGWPGELCHRAMDRWGALAEECEDRARLDRPPEPCPERARLAEALGGRSLARPPGGAPGARAAVARPHRGPLRLAAGVEALVAPVEGLWPGPRERGLVRSGAETLVVRLDDWSLLATLGWDGRGCAGCRTFAPSESLVALGGVERLQVADVAAGPQASWLPAERVVSCLEFSPCGRWLVSSGSSGRVDVWDLQDPASSVSVQAYLEPVHALHLCGGGGLLVTVPFSPSGRMRVWTFPMPHLLFELPRMVFTVASPGAPNVVCGLVPRDDEYDVVAQPLCEGGAGRLLGSLGRFELPLAGRALSPDGSVLAWLDVRGRLSLADVLAGKLLVDRQPLASPAADHALAFLPDGRLTLVTDLKTLHVLEPV